MATAFSIVLYNTARLIFIYIKMGIHPFSLKTAVVFVILLGGYFVNLLVPFVYNVFIDIIVRSGIVIIFLFTLIFYSKASIELNKNMIKFASKLLNKFRN